VVSGVPAIALATLTGLAFRERSQHRGALALISLAVLVALVVGAAVAAKRQSTGTPMMHGIITTLAATILLTAIRFIWHALDGTRTPVSFAAAMSNLLLAIVCGMIGGVVGGRRRRSPATGR
jgi:putative membrane protein (TIGR04086 family)